MYGITVYYMRVCDGAGEVSRSPELEGEWLDHEPGESPEDIADGRDITDRGRYHLEGYHLAG